MKLNPAVRTGLIFMGVHQAWALVGLTGMWLWFPAFLLSGAVLFVADIPSILMGSASGFLTSGSSPKFFVAFSKHLPEVGSGFADIIVLVLTLGAAQWFLIGYAVGARRSKREAAAVKS